MGYYFSKFSTVEAARLAPSQVLVINLVLIAVLSICAYTDGTRGKIYNKITFPAMALGLALNGAFGGWQGLMWAFLGWALGMGIQWIPFMLGFAKAGDVKFLAAVGALKGWAFCLFGFFYGAAAFGFLILPVLARRGELGAVSDTIKGYFKTAAVLQAVPEAPAPVAVKRYTPWGVALAVGFFIALALEMRIGRPFWLLP